MSQSPAARRRKTARAKAVRTRERAMRAAGAGTTARRVAYRTRAWAAPALERTGYALEERVAPKMSSVLRGAAAKIDPPRPSRRRWPFVAAGVVLVVGGTTAVMLLKRRKLSPLVRVATPEPDTEVIARSARTEQEATKPPAQRAKADVNGRVHAG